MSIAARLAELGIEPPTPVAPEVVAARVAFDEALRGLLRIGDDNLVRPWAWRGGGVSVRYCFYRCYELIEAATAAVEAAGAARPEGARIVGQATAATWDLHGLLLAETDAEAARAPDGDWSILQTLAHIQFGQESFSLGAAWAVHRQRAGGDVPVVPEALRQSRSGFAPAQSASLAEARRELDEALDEAAGLFATLGDEPGLRAPAMWSGFEVTVRFRLGRMASHLREHTIQVEKTLVLLGRAPSEVERMVRSLAGAYGRLAGVCVGLAPVPGVLAESVEQVRSHVREVTDLVG